jgi:hypothetical protein
MRSITQRSASGLPSALEGEMDGSELDDGFGHLLGPVHSGTLHAVLVEMFASAFDWAIGDRPAIGEVFVIAQSGAVPVKVVGDSLECFAFGSGDTAFGDTLTEPFDEDVGGFPQLFQRVHQIQNESKPPASGRLESGERARRRSGPRGFWMLTDRDVASLRLLPE